MKRTARDHRKCFNPLNKVNLARDKLSRWCQGKDVKTYITDFLDIIIDIPGIRTDDPIDRYSRGLKLYIWTKRCTTDYTKLEDLMRDADIVESAKANRPRKGIVSALGSRHRARVQSRKSSMLYPPHRQGSRRMKETVASKNAYVLMLMSPVQRKGTYSTSLSKNSRRS
jgi:hypothetical protein